MNPWVIIGAGIFWVLSVGGAYVKGQTTGANRVIAQQVAVDQAVRDTRAAAQQGAADAIAQIKIVNTTIRGKTETIVRENRVYADCVNDAGVLRNINQALTRRAPEPAGSVVVPKADGAK